MKTIHYFPVAVVGLLLSTGLLVAQDSRMLRLEQVPVSGAPTNVAPAVSQLPERAGESLEDLGPELILARRSKPKVFELSADTQYAFNSNIQMTKQHQESDGEFDATVKLTASPRLLPQLTSMFYIDQQFIRYNTYHINNYDAQSAGLSLSHPIGPNGSWGAVYGGFSATRLCYPLDAGEFYKECDTLIGWWRTQPLGKRVTLSYTYQLDWLPAHPSSSTRIYNAIAGSLGVKITDQFMAQLYYRLRDQEYLQTTRNDLDHLVYLTFSYTYNQYLAARVYGSYGDSTSNLSDKDYRVLNGGGGLALSLKF